MHNDLDSKPHVHHLKVVDTENDEEVMAYAKWEIYPHGCPDLDALSKPIDPADKAVDSFGPLREAAHECFCRCNGEMGKHPHIRESKPEPIMPPAKLTYPLSQSWPFSSLPLSTDGAALGACLFNGALRSLNRWASRRIFKPPNKAAALWTLRLRGHGHGRVQPCGLWTAGSREDDGDAEAASYRFGASGCKLSSASVS